jgi:DNA ligase 1
MKPIFLFGPVGGKKSMCDPVKIIKALQATNSRLDKEKILEDAWKNREIALFKGFYYCYNPFITFGVADKSVPIHNSETRNYGAVPFTNKGIFGQLDLLVNREVTGNAAKDYIKLTMDYIKTEEWNLFYRPIILKDMRCGVTSTTINKVLTKISKSDREAKKYIIPIFECQLAKDGVEETFEGKVILQEKLDGVRLIIFCDVEKKSVIMYTRNGKENHNFPHIEKIFEDVLPSLKESMVFDGEVVGDNFQSVMTQVNRKEKVDSKNTKLALFDCLPLSDFKKEISDIPQLQRLEMIDTFSLFSDNSDQSPVFKLDSLIVDMSTKEGIEEFKVFNQKAIDAGKEGIMVKKPDAPYECKRSKSWLKIKPFIEETLEIIEVEIGSGKNAGRLGNLLCEGTVNDKQVKVSVGGGFTEEQREEFWVKRESLKGMLIEVRADALTKSANDDNIWSMRFPRFKGFRGSEPGEKI